MSNPVAELIRPTRVNIHLELASKKRALEVLSQLLSSAQPNLTTEEIFTCLLYRERLGSTSIGNGVALPHGRLKGLLQPVGAFVTLVKPVDYQAVDDQPVDVLFAMLVPDEDDQAHLDTLDHLANLFADADVAVALRGAATPDAAFALLTQRQIDAKQCSL